MDTRAVTSHHPDVAVPQRKPSLTVVVAWAAVLLVSLLPDILWRETTGSAPDALVWGKIALMGLLLLVSFVWKPIRALRGLFFIFMVLFLSGWVVGLLAETALWRNWFRSGFFSADMLQIQVQKLLVTLLMIVALRLTKRRRAAFFLVIGDTRAMAEPVRWLGMDRPLSWSRLGPIASICIGGGVLLFLLLAGGMPPVSVQQVVPLIPAILLFALMNAFSEEVSYRASLLSALDGVVNKSQAILLTAVYFGIAHFYGVPYGIIGVVMAGLLGWFLGKAMLETRGLFWPGFIHFVQDVLIFLFIAIGTVNPGG